MPGETTSSGLFSRSGRAWLMAVLSQRWALEGYGVGVVLIRFRRGPPDEIRTSTG